MPGLRFAIRNLRKSPLFTAVAILSLALGIGANTAIFSLLDQLLLRLLPVRDPRQLVLLNWRGSFFGSNNGSNALSYPLYRELRDGAPMFDGVLCRAGTTVALGYAGDTERATAEFVSGNYFSVLGVDAAVGRLITPEDDRVPEGHPVAVLSYDFWRERFAGDPGILGKAITVNGSKFTVIGVSQAGFHGIEAGNSPKLRVPVMMKKTLSAGWQQGYRLEARRAKWVQVIGRLKPGVTPEQAQAGLQPLFKTAQMADLDDLRQTDPSRLTPAGRERFLRAWLQVIPAARGRSALRSQFAAPLRILMAMVGLVLLIACANVANLLLARAAAREKEIAVRLALGSSRSQVIRQLMVENLLLALGAGTAGVLAAVWGTRFLIGLLPAGEDAYQLSATPDLRVLGFALGVSLLTALVFGLAPAWQATRLDLAPVLKQQASAAAAGVNPRFRQGLVVAQVFLSLLLLAGAGLFLRSLRNLRQVDPGFSTGNLIVFSVDPTKNGHTGERAPVFFRHLQDKLAAIPGVEAASFGIIRPLSGNDWSSSVVIEGHVPKPGENMNPYFNAVTPGYFAALGIRVLEGREFRPSDAKGAAQVGIVNQRFARQYFGNQSALGRRFGFGKDPDIEIVGVVADTKYDRMRDDAERQVFIAANQSEALNDMTGYVRTRQEPEQVFGAVRRAVAEVDRNVPVYDMRTMDAQVSDHLSTERMVAWLASAFGLAATLLASLGLYGVLAYTVARRTREIGLRMALGAREQHVAWLVAREVLLLTGLGVGLALPAAYALAGLVRSQLYEIEAQDPVNLALAATVLAGIALFAALGPARRATRIDPMVALRHE